MLRDHPDKQYVRYILDGIEHGFRIGFNGNKSAGLQSATSNMQSASVHHIVITEYLQMSVRKGISLVPSAAVTHKVCTSVASG